MNLSLKDTWNSVANIYDDKFSPLTLYDKSYDAFLALINNDKTQILEVGCGPGNIAKYFLQKKTELNWMATDFSKEMISIAASKLPNAKFKELDARDILSINLKFDAIVAGFCLPYLNELETQKFFMDCHALLYKNGKVYISVETGNYEDSEYKRSSDSKIGMQFYYYDLKFLKPILEKAGFRILEEMNIEYDINPNNRANHLVLFVEKT